MGQMQIWGALSTASLAVLIPTYALWSQEVDGGVLMTLDVQNSVRAHSNIGLDPADPGPTYRAQTSLSFGLSSETRTQSLAVTLGTVLRYNRGPTQNTTGLDDPVLAVSFSREMANSRLSFDASYTRGEVSGFAQVFDPDLGTTSLIADDGTRTSYQLGTSLELGTQGPLGVTASLGYGGVSYNGTTDAALFDQATVSASLETELKFSDVLSGTGSLFVSRFEAQDAVKTTRDTRAVSLGFVYTPDARTEITANLGGRQIESSVAGTSESAEGSLSYSRALPNGALTATLSRQLTIAGQQNRFDLERSFDFATSQLELAVGVVDADGADLQPVAALTFSQDLPRGSLTASLATSVSVDSDANVQQTVTGALGYTQSLSSTTEMSLGLSVTDVNDISNSGLTERQQGTFSASLTRSLAQDWDLSLGAERRYLDQAGATAWDNSIFVGLNRSFAVRP